MGWVVEEGKDGYGMLCVGGVVRMLVRFFVGLDNFCKVG